MGLQETPNITLNDIYNYAISSGYTGTSELSELILWDEWFNIPDGADSILDFLGVGFETGYDISNPTLEFVLNVSIDLDISVVVGIFIGDNGKKMYILSQSTKSIYEYNLPIPWNISGATYNQQIQIPNLGSETRLISLYFNFDGNKCFTTGNDTDRIQELELTTPWDISTLINVNVVENIENNTRPSGIYYKPDGYELYIVDDDGQMVRTYTVSSPFTISGLTINNSKTLITSDVDPRGLYFNSNGKRLILLGRGSDKLYSYNLTTPYDLSTASLEQTLDLTSFGIYECQGISLRSNGTSIYISDSLTNSIYQFELN